MLSYVWPKDRPDLRARVAISLGFLGGAKVRICFKKILQLFLVSKLLSVEHSQLLGLSLTYIIISFIEQKLYDTGRYFFLNQKSDSINLMEFTSNRNV